MPVEFRMESKSGNVLENTHSCSRDSVRVLMAYDGSGRRVSKTRMRKAMRRSASPKTTVVVNLPQGLGRYQPEDAVDGFNGVRGDRRAGYRPPAKFEWYLKNHLGSTMLVYGTSAYDVFD